MAKMECRNCHENKHCTDGQCLDCYILNRTKRVILHEVAKDNPDLYGALKLVDDDLKDSTEEDSGNG